MKENHLINKVTDIYISLPFTDFLNETYMIKFHNFNTKIPVGLPFIKRNCNFFLH